MRTSSSTWLAQRDRAFALVLTALLMTLAFGLMVSSAVRKSSTVDEQTHLFRGTAYLLERATQFRDVHPPLGFALQSVLMLTEPDLRLPSGTAAWVEGRWEQAADAFLWQLNANPLRLIFLGRMVSLWLTLLLGAVVVRWARELGGWLPALVALVLLLFDPNILAHGHLMTNDISVTLYMTLATYSFWRWCSSGRWTAILWLGLGLGLAGATKYSAITLVPALVVIALGVGWRRRTWRPLLGLVAGGALSVLVIWALYGFAFRPVPLAPLWDDLSWTISYFGRPSGAYLLGQTRAGGWWYYFPIAYLVKTPLVILGLGLCAAALTGWSIWQRRQPRGMGWMALAFLTVPPLLYLLISMAGPLNIGYRHLLPVLPYAAVFIAVSLLGERVRASAWARAVVVALAGSMVLLAILVWPDYIPYFNRLAGGPDRSWRILSDSNIDWGQDLPALASWNHSRSDGLPLYLSYFGTAHPRAYGINYIPLPTWAPTPEQLPPDRRVFDPADPAPGRYAISVTNLHGHVLSDPDLYVAFRVQRPQVILGDSLRIYNVVARGPGFDLALSGLTPAELAAALRGRLPGNDRQLRWLVDGDGLVWSEDGLWLAAGRPVAAELQPYLPQAVATAEGQTLYHLGQPPQPPWATRTDTFGDALTLLGTQIADSSDNGETMLISLWRVEQATDRPLKLFVHALDASGNLLSQWDGLSVDPDSLQPGDTFVQVSRLPATALPPERIVMGVYDGETLERLTMADGRDAVTIYQR